jgi:two-component system phosphate regulon response regulator PhoB
VERGSLARWFVVRLADIMKLEVPSTRGPDRPSGPALQADLLNVPEVVVVEDDLALAELLEYGLRSRGYRFASYRNGRDALDDLLALDLGDAHPLLLLDVDLPALDGYSIFERLQRERPGVYRVVFTTVHGDEGEQLRGLEAGALDYLVKPISLRVALEKIRRWVGR